MVEPAKRGEKSRAVDVQRLSGEHLNGRRRCVGLRDAGAAAKRAVREGARRGELSLKVSTEALGEGIAIGGRGREREPEFGRDIVEQRVRHLLL